MSMDLNSLLTMAREGYSPDLLKVLLEFALSPAQFSYQYAALNSQDRRSAAMAAGESARTAIAQMQASMQRDIAMSELGLNRDKLGLESQQLDLQRELGLAGLGLDRDRFGLQSELGRGGLALDRERLQLAREGQAADTQFRLAQLLASMGGPRNAFKQQAVVNGLNAAGISNAVDAVAGRINLPAYQANQATPEPMTLQTFQADTGITLPGFGGDPSANAGSGLPLEGSYSQVSGPVSGNQYPASGASLGAAAGPVGNRTQHVPYGNANLSGTPTYGGPGPSITGSLMTRSGSGSAPGQAAAMGAPSASTVPGGSPFAAPSPPAGGYGGIPYQGNEPPTRQPVPSGVVPPTLLMSGQQYYSSPYGPIAPVTGGMYGALNTQLPGQPPQPQGGLTDADLRDLFGPDAPLLGVPSYAVGTFNVPRTGLARVHAGEAILPAPVAEQFRRQPGVPNAGPIAAPSTPSIFPIINPPVWQPTFDGFKQAFGFGVGDTAYNAAFDLNSDGRITPADFSMWKAQGGFPGDQTATASTAGPTAATTATVPNQRIDVTPSPEFGGLDACPVGMHRVVYDQATFDRTAGRSGSRCEPDAPSTEDPHTCPVGTHWDAATQSCIPDNPIQPTNPTTPTSTGVSALGGGAIAGGGSPSTGPSTATLLPVPTASAGPMGGGAASLGSGGGVGAGGVTLPTGASPAGAMAPSGATSMGPLGGGVASVAMGGGAGSFPGGGAAGGPITPQQVQQQAAQQQLDNLRQAGESRAAQIVVQPNGTVVITPEPASPMADPSAKVPIEDPSQWTREADQMPPAGLPSGSGWGQNQPGWEGVDLGTYLDQDSWRQYQAISQRMQAAQQAYQAQLEQLRQQYPSEGGIPAWVYNPALQPPPPDAGLSAYEQSLFRRVQGTLDRIPLSGATAPGGYDDFRWAGIGAHGNVKSNPGGNGPINPYQAGNPTYDALLAKYGGALPPPNRMRPQAFFNLPSSSQQFLLGAYEALGYDPNDVLDTLNKLMPHRAANPLPFAAVLR